MNNYNIKDRPYKPLQCAYSTSHNRYILDITHKPYIVSFNYSYVTSDHCLMANYMTVSLLL